MPSTPRYGFRYPVGTDSDNPPLHLSQLASDVEARLGVVEDGPRPRHFVINAGGTGSVQPNNNTASGSVTKTVPTCTALVRISGVIVAFTGGDYQVGLGVRVDSTDYFGPTPSYYVGSGGGTINYSAAIQVPLTAGSRVFLGRFTIGTAPGGVDWRFISLDVVLGAAG